MEDAFLYVCYTCENLLWMRGILQIPVTRSKKRHFFALILFFLFLAAIKLQFFGNNLSPFGILFDCIIVLLLFSGNPATLLLKYLFSFFYMGVLTTPIEFLFFFLFDICNLSNHIYLEHFFLEILILMIIFCASLLLHRYPSVAITIQQIPWYYFLVGLLIGISISLISSFTGFMAEEMPFYVKATYTTAGYLVEELVYLFGIFLFYQGELRKKYQKENAQKDILLKKLEQYYLSLEKNQKEIRQLRHDMKKHLDVLRYFLTKHNDSGAQKYLEEITSHLPDGRVAPIEVGNDLVNAVIKNEKDQMSEEIELICSGLLCSNLEITPFDLCTIFSNLLSNAREACEKLEYSERKIILNVGGKAGHFELRIKNPIEWPVDTAKIGTFSSKKDSEHHGLGLLNVIETVEKYDGLIRFSSSEQRFEVYISI